METARNSPNKSREIEHLCGPFLDAAADAVIIVDETGRIVHHNSQAEQLFGRRQDQLLGEPVEILIPETLRANHEKHLRHYFSHPSPQRMGGIRLIALRGDGTEFPVDIALTPLPSESGILVACAVRDMTYQHRFESELRQHMHDLEDADRHKDQFLTTLAHELRSPLAAITYVAELMRRSTGSSESCREAAGIVLEEVRLIQRLLRDLDELSHIKRGSLVVDMATIDLVAVARMGLEVSQQLIARRRHTLDVVLPKDPVWVRGDTTRLAQIVTNLLNNAARYTPNGGCIQLTVEEQAGAAVIRVKDSGIGIPSHQLTRIFEMFVRLDDARSKHTGGMGIGLAFVRQLVKMHGGSVDAFSAGEGYGSEFVVRLPVATNEP